VTRWSAQRLLVLVTALDDDDAESAVRDAWRRSSPRKPFPVVISLKTLSARDSTRDAIAAAEADLVDQQAAWGEDLTSDGHAPVPPLSGPRLTRILVVEDDPFASGLLMDRLAREGDFDVTVLDDGADALDRVSSEVFDLAILDGMLPGLDGLDLLARIREDKAWDHVPVIMLTGRTDERDLVRGLELGADDYVVKPFSPIEVLARVRRLLEHGDRED
jgi:CheY-like chemotaxis protein